MAEEPREYSLVDAEGYVVLLPYFPLSYPNTLILFTETRRRLPDITLAKALPTTRTMTPTLAHFWKA